MFLLAQLSDLHLALRPKLIELAGKRGLGFINWHRSRKYIHRVEVLDAIVRDLNTIKTDHIAVTGDLVNLSLPAEYALARTWLDRLGSPHDVTVIPGNHDAYVAAARGGPAESWSDYMRGDDGAASGTFPFVRRRGPVALIALSSALPTGAFMATGELGHEQLSRLATVLEATRGCIPHRAGPPPAGDGTQPAFTAFDRRSRTSPRAGGAGRRTGHPWPRSLPRTGLARRPGETDPCHRSAVGVGARPARPRRRRRGTTSSASTAKPETGAAR